MATRAQMAIMASGARVNVSSPHPSEVSGRDLAHGLAKLCLWRGATSVFYSYAQHSRIVADAAHGLAGPRAALYALLHAAWRAVLDSDAASGLMRAGVERAIHEAFDLEWPTPAATARTLAAAHAAAEYAERAFLLAEGAAARETARQKIMPLRAPIRPLAWDRALDDYLKAFKTYGTLAGLPHLPAFGELL